MRKLLVRPIDCLLIDIATGSVFVPERPTVTEGSVFVQQKIAVKQLQLITDLDFEATDAEWAEYLKSSDNDIDLALSAYKAKLAGHDDQHDAEAEAKAKAEAEAAVRARVEAEAKAKAEAEAKAKAEAEAEAEAKAKAKK